MGLRVLTQLLSPCMLLSGVRTSPGKRWVFKLKPQTWHIGVYGPCGLWRGGKRASPCHTPLPVATQTLLSPNAGCSLYAQREDSPIPRAPWALASTQEDKKPLKHTAPSHLGLSQHREWGHHALYHTSGTEGPYKALLPIPHPSLLLACPHSNSKSPAHC